MMSTNQYCSERFLSSSSPGIVSHRVGTFILVWVISVVTMMTQPHITNAWTQIIQPSTSTSSLLLRPIVLVSSSNQNIFYYHRYHQRPKYIQPLQSTNDVILNIDSNSADMKQKKDEEEVILYDYEIPEDAVIHIKPAAMRRLRELRDQRQRELSSSSSKDSHDDDDKEFLILRMGVRSGGCSGMSYVMDFCTKDSINGEDDQIDVYHKDKIKCVVDSKSMLYLYGLQLDYSTQLIGGGFKFYNPNAEESCGCGSSFGV